MPTRQGKKQNKGTRNPDRRNGKAWKKGKDARPKAKTPERQLKDSFIREGRLRRYEDNKTRRAEQERLAAELAEQVATEVAQKVAEENARNAARVALKKVHRAHVVA